MIRIKIRNLNILTERVVIFYTQTTIFIMNTLDNQHGSLEICQMLITFRLILRIRMFERVARKIIFLRPSSSAINDDTRPPEERASTMTRSVIPCLLIVFLRKSQRDNTALSFL
ncbi:hypothetical protein BFW41_06955 [Aeromonas hydrophila]|nr:hypothetical protein BFW41_06955 [Aeromonas hydrophila]